MRMVRRRCVHCNRLYQPDPRNRRHQRYCSRAACRRVSKHSSQHTWIQSRKGREYFSDSENSSRVQNWRKLNPGYRKNSRHLDVLQDFFLKLQLLGPSDHNPNVGERALIDVLNSYCLLLLGLMTKLPKTNKKEIIDETFRSLILAGKKAREKLLEKTGSAANRVKGNHGRH